MFQKPAFFQTGSIEKSAVLLFGIGGGYDVFCGIPLLHELSNEGVPVVLANLSFAFDLDKKQNPKQETIGIEKTICIAAHHADHDENAFSGPDFPANYYPEFQLSQWLKKHKNFDTSVYTFNLRGERGPKLGIKNYAAALSAICDKHKVGHIVLVDAGVDSVCKGDEERVGTFSEDLMSFLAVRRLQGVKRYVMCVGLGTESNISEYDFLQNWNDIAKLGGFLGSVAWTKDMPSVKDYLDALQACHPTNTTVNSAIAASIEQHFGQFCPPHLYSRGLRDFDMKLQPLTTFCFFFSYEAVEKHRLFLDECEPAISQDDLENRFHVAREIFFKGSAHTYIGPRKYKQMF